MSAFACYAQKCMLCTYVDMVTVDQFFVKLQRSWLLCLIQEGLKAYTLEQIDASETLQKTRLDEGSKKIVLDALRKELE